MLLGITLALIAAFSKGVEKILHKFVLVKEDSLSYAFVWHALTAVIFLPFFIIEFSLPQEPLVWLLPLASSALWALVAYFGFTAYSLLDVSVKAPLDKSRLFFILLFSALFLKETITVTKVTGVLLIFIGIMIISWKLLKKRKKNTLKGIVYTLLSAVIITSAWMIDKVAVSYFTPGFYSFLVFFIPSLFLLPFVINRKEEIKSIFTNRFSATLVTVIFSAIYYYMLLWALRNLDASIVLPLTELATLVAVLGGIIFLKERKDLARKLIGTAVVILGAIILIL